MESLLIYKISPDPSLLKRGTKLVPDIFIIPLWKREILSSPRWKRGSYLLPVGKGALIFPPFSTTLFVIEPAGSDLGPWPGSMSF